jgi:hypothetical protein
MMHGRQNIRIDSFEQKSCDSYLDPLIHKDLGESDTTKKCMTCIRMYTFQNTKWSKSLCAADDHNTNSYK